MSPDRTNFKKYLLFDATENNYIFSNRLRVHRGTCLYADSRRGSSYIHSHACMIQQRVEFGIETCKQNPAVISATPSREAISGFEPMDLFPNVLRIQLLSNHLATWYIEHKHKRRGNTGPGHFQPVGISRGVAEVRNPSRVADEAPSTQQPKRKTNEAGKSRSTSATSHQSKYGNTSIDIDVRIKVTGHRVTATNLICGFT
ncbi:uncharacterized protein CIMG_00462 [Coccidioides immitis RS]|uniref:Uncharacterized protein n=1 Tax=Coccidioides immitis (strain RS) TaxID=246410 RepID=J3KH19_COCIM|nr:uncharacterized protein CIMG_00462 [Coccidioides immitis RS]EAS35108.3 hypothetical protein CIMG_00462 [Coccidioides immitis RS]